MVSPEIRQRTRPVWAMARSTGRRSRPRRARAVAVHDVGSARIGGVNVPAGRVAASLVAVTRCGRLRPRPPPMGPESFGRGGPVRRPHVDLVVAGRPRRFPHHTLPRCVRTRVV